MIIGVIEILKDSQVDVAFSSLSLAPTHMCGTATQGCIPEILQILLKRESLPIPGHWPPWH